MIGRSLTLNTLETLTDGSGHFLGVVTGDRRLDTRRYRFVGTLGAGGMGNVYLADDLLLSRQVAVKTVRPSLSGNKEVRARIKRECRMHAAIGTHPHIVTLYDTVEEDGQIYLVMEYFAGETLAGLLAATPDPSGLPLRQALDITRQLLQALACIHGRDIVHRDIKTSNILLQLQGDERYLVKLTDFGIARAETETDGMTRLTSLGTQGPGTPVYMAPERIDSQTFGDICPATDLYAVGIILYELLAGVPPFKGGMTEIFSGHLTQQPALTVLPPGIPTEVKRVLHKVLAKKPSDRYQDAAAFLDALAAIDEGSESITLPGGIQEVTLLAPDNGSTVVTVCNPTVLDPTAGRGKTAPVFKRKGLYLLAMLVVVFAGYFLTSRFTGEPVSHSARSAEIAATAAELAFIAPATGQLLGNQAEEKTSSALQAVEDIRQPKISASRPPADPTGTGTASKQDWLVIENSSRKIH